MEQEHNAQFAHAVIDELGGTRAVAREYKITQGAVSQWLKNGIPPLRVEILRRDHPDLKAWTASAANV